MAWILSYMSYSEFTKLVICACLDIVEYVIPILLQPIMGDLFDLIGVLTCLFLFKWIGLISILELIPSFDVLPINIVTWIIWFVYNHWKDFSYRNIKP